MTDRIPQIPSWKNAHFLLPIMAAVAMGVMVARVTIRILENTEAILTLPLVSVSFSDAIIPCLVVYCVGLIFCSCRRSPIDRFEIFTIAFVIRIILGFILAYIYQFQDEQILHEFAESIIYFRDEAINPGGYVKVISILYAIFGANLLLPKILNAMLGSILPFLIYDITAQLSPNTHTARRALYFCVFLPPLWFYSTVFLKELPSTFFLILSIWGLVVPCWPLLMRMGFSLLIVMITFFIRGGWALLPLLAIILYLFLGDGIWQPRRLLSIRRLLLISALAVFLGFPLRPVLDDMIEHINFRLFIGTYASFGTLETTQSSVTRSLIDTSQPWALRNLAIQLLRAPFSPLSISSLLSVDVRAIFDLSVSLTQYALMPLALIGLITSWRRSAITVLAISEFVMLITIGLSLMLGLTIQRHIIPHFAIVYILAGIGMENYRKYTSIILGWFALALVYILIYNVVHL